MDSSTDKTREIRLRRTAQRQGLVLPKSRARDPLAIGYGLFHIADANNVGVAGYGLMGYEMNADEVEVYLADAQDFDVYFSNPCGDYWPGDRPILEWMDSYWFGRSWSSGWLLSERADSPRDHFVIAGRAALASAAIEARHVLRTWADESHE